MSFTYFCSYLFQKKSLKNEWSKTVLVITNWSRIPPEHRPYTKPIYLTLDTSKQK